MTLWKMAWMFAAGAFAAGVLAAGAASAQKGGQLDPGDSTFKNYALSETAGSLHDAENAVNRQWTNATAESLTELLTSVPKEGFARIRSKAVDVEMSVPLGWHAIEDNERLAIFNPDRTVRIIVWRVDLEFEGVPDLEKYLVGKAAALRVRYPKVQATSRALPNGSFLGVFNDVPPRAGDKEPRAIFDLLTPNPQNPKRALLMTFGTPASQTDRYLPLLALLERSQKIKWTKER